jgi:lycopene beta-cyclase
VHDIVIIGAGPAAWSLAAACGTHGLNIALVAPEPDRAWAQTYSVWADQLEPSVCSLFANGIVPLAHRWDQVVAIGSTTRTLSRSYVQLANSETRSGLQETAESQGVLTIRATTVREVRHNETSSTVSLAKGRALTARVVVDASGAGSPFVERENASGLLAMQSAFGLVVELDRSPYDEGTAVFMDWRGPSRKDPSFLYALDRRDGTWLVEETSLARTPELSLEVLEARLHERLKTLGVRITSTQQTEHVLFPMNASLPFLGQRTVAIGAAAGVVHPATGYSVAASMRLAPRMAKALANGLGRDDTSMNQIARAAWDVVWSSDRRKARKLEAYGLERLLTMDQGETRSFFDAFFSLGPTVGATYLSGEASSAELASVMWKVFQRAPFRLRQRLATGNPLTLARSLIG